MTTEIYIDDLKGSDSLGNGSQDNPYKTLEYFCNNIAIKTNGDYIVYLEKGTYEITSNNIFGQFVSGNLTIIGLREKTEILQKTGMYVNSVGGYANFTLNIARCRYNILPNLTSSNLMGFNWKWNFYNVLFEYTPDNGYSVFSSATSMIIRNCVKLTNTTCFLRKNSSTISIYDSIGYFTSGYSTSQSDWDKGGNTIGSIDNYDRVLKKGLYKWNIEKSFILHDGVYKKFNPEIRGASETENAIPTMISNIAPFGRVSSSGVSSSFYAWYAFNKNINEIGWISSSAKSWIQYQFREPKIIIKYSVTNASSASTVSYATRAPKNWTFEGSNDGLTWDILDTQTDQISWESSQKRTFSITNTRPYLTYRLNITVNNGSNDTAINEFEMFEAFSERVAPHWSTVSTTLPTSTQFLEQGMDNLSSIDRTVAEFEPLSMIDKSEILGTDEVGKLFSKTIDLKKIFDIRSIRTEVK